MAEPRLSPLITAVPQCKTTHGLLDRSAFP